MKGNENGCFHKGKWVISDGHYYEGGFKDDLYHGFGIEVIGKYRREGNWVEGKFTGKGKVVNEEGIVSEGNWVDGEMEGEGKFRRLNGSSYTGKFVKGEAQGKGEYIDEFGTVYKGIFHKGLQTGAGSYKEKNGSFYQGNFLHGMRHGKGKFTVMNKGVIAEEYDGSWKEDLFHGFGIHTSGLTTEKGKWVEGEKEGEFEVTISMTSKIVYKKSEEKK